MRIALVFVGFLFTSFLFASNSTIRLRGGESATLTASVETTVICENSQRELVERFCSCFDIGPQYRVTLHKHYMFSDGTRTQIELGSYEHIGSCEKAREANAGCK